MCEDLHAGTPGGATTRNVSLRRPLASGDAFRATPPEHSRDLFEEYTSRRAGACFFPPRGGLAQQRCDSKNTLFESDFSAPVRAARTRRDEGAVWKKFRAQEAPRSELSAFPARHPPCLPTFLSASFFSSGGAAARKLVSVILYKRHAKSAAAEKTPPRVALKETGKDTSRNTCAFR